MLNLREGAHFSRAHHLVLVKQKDGNAGCCDKFVDLQTVRPESGSSVTIDRRLPDSMSLIHDQNVQAVGIGRHELVEILEQGANLRRSECGNFSQRLGKGAGPGCVDDSAAAARQLTIETFLGAARLAELSSCTACGMEIRLRGRVQLARPAGPPPGGAARA